MKLHLNKEFNNIANIVSSKLNIPMEAVIKDYHIVRILNNLNKTEYSDRIVFKGGTSLSKCYNNIIERFSEDIDLTFLKLHEDSEKSTEKKLKEIEKVLIGDYRSEKINHERSTTNKSSWIMFEKDKIKVELGCNSRPDPYKKLYLKSYIHEYLEEIDEYKYIKEMNLREIEINVLCITRTFVDKLFAIKRHCYMGTITSKIRHVYDVYKMFDQEDIKNLLLDKTELKRLIELTRESNNTYLKRRRNVNIEQLNNFSKEEILKRLSNKKSRKAYEQLQDNLLFTAEKQNYDEALNTIKKIIKIIEELD